MGAEFFLHLFAFSTTWILNGEYLLNETWHRQSSKGVRKYEGSPKVSQNLINVRQQTAENRTGVFTHPHYFLSQSITHPLCAINVAPHIDSKWNCFGFVCSSAMKPQKMLSWKRYRVGRP